MTPLWFAAALMAGSGICAATTPAASSAEKVAAARTGKTVRWQKDEAAREAAQAAVERLLGKPLTEKSAVQVALLNNAALQATFEEIGISEADLLEAGLLKNPAIEGMIRFPNSPADIGGSLVEDFLDVALRPLRKRAARAQLAQTELRVADEVLKLATETRIAWYEAAAHQELASRSKLGNEAAQAAIDLAQRQHEAGNISDLELAEAQASSGQTRLEAAAVEADSREKREKLNRCLGVWGSRTGWRITAKLPPMPVKEIPLEGLESLALEQRLDLGAARAELASLVQALGLTKTYRFTGDIELGVSGERDADRNIRTGPTLRLELPIFNHGQARVARGEAQVRQAERRIEALAAQIHAEVREVYNRMRARREAALAYRDDLLPARVRIVNLTQLNYNAMFAGAFDLLQAKQSEVEVEAKAIEATRDYWVARTELERAVGGAFRKDAP